MSTTAAEVCVLATGHGAGPCPLQSGAWLAVQPRGTYTTARTVGGASIFELSFHIERLATSARLMMQADEEQGRPDAPHLRRQHAALTDATSLRPAVLSSLRAAMSAYRSASGDGAGELKLTVLLTWGVDGSDVATHAQPLGACAAPPIKVQVRGAPRSNAEAKDSDWVRQRRCYEEEKPSDVNEVVLANADGSMYEGLSSNFYALVDGALHTAGEGILLGSMREATLRVAQRLSVPVVLHPPQVAHLSAWDGCFISSTSRMLLPVDELSAPGHDPPLCRQFVRSGLVEALQQGVADEVAACSEPVFE